MAQRIAIPGLIATFPQTLRRNSFLVMVVSLILALLVLPILLMLAGVGMLRANGTPVVLNEVYASLRPNETPDAQWVELYNTTDAAISLAGWSLYSAHGLLLTIEELTIPPRSFAVVAAAPQRFRAQFPGVVFPVTGGFAGPLDPQADGLLLRSADGQTVDELFWGRLDPSWEHQPGRWTPGAPLAAREPGRTFVRKSLGVDSDAASDWRGDGMPTPGRTGRTALTPLTYWFLFDFTNYLSVVGGFALWIAFAMIGLVAQRFERLTNQRSYWQALVIAPIGISIYNIIQARAFFTRGIMTRCTVTPTSTEYSLQSILNPNTCEQGYAFVALFLSAIITLAVVFRFARISRRILES